MSTTQLGAAAGLAASTIHSWEARRYEPRIDKLARVASVLGVEVVDFLEDEMPSSWR